MKALSPAEQLDIDLAVQAMRQKAKPRSSTNPVKSIERAGQEVGQRKEDVEFWRNEAKAAHFVALYVWLHTQFYGVPPAELTQPKTALMVLSSAKRFIEKEFFGDGIAYLDFIRWVFRGEKLSREKGKSSDFVITWRFVFTATNSLTRYRMWRLEKGERVQ